MNLYKKLSFFIFLSIVLFLGFTRVSFATTSTLYFNNATSTSWDDLENWWTDASFSTPASSIPVNGDTVYLGATTTAPSVTVTLAHIYVASSTTGGGSFPVNFGNGMVGGQANGDATFYDHSHDDYGTLTGNGTFYDSSYAYQGIITGNAVFYNSSYSNAIVNGTGTFHDTSNNNGYVYGDGTFYDQSSSNNYLWANAYFYDQSTLNHIVYTGNAFFSCSANNFGTVGGTITYGVTCPTIVSGSLATNNSYIDITVSEPVWGDNSSTTILTGGKFSITFNQNAGNVTGASISSLTKTTGGSLDGSETVIRANLSITGTSTGVETIVIKPLNGISIYNAAGDPMRPEQTTGTKTLHNQSISPSPVNYGGGGSSYNYPLNTTSTSTATSTATSTGLTSTSTTTSIVVTPSVVEIKNPVYQFAFTQILKLGSIGDEVKQLQVFLNAHGFLVSQTGNGSKGKETIYFGKKTQQALIKFQEANLKDILTPQKLKKGTGIFWIYSKKFINEILLGGN